MSSFVFGLTPTAVGEFWEEEQALARSPAKAADRMRVTRFMIEDFLFAEGCAQRGKGPAQRTGRRPSWVVSSFASEAHSISRSLVRRNLRHNSRLMFCRSRT